MPPTACIDKIVDKELKDRNPIFNEENCTANICNVLSKTLIFCSTLRYGCLKSKTGVTVITYPAIIFIKDIKENLIVMSYQILGNFKNLLKSV